MFYQIRAPFRGTGRLSTVKARRLALVMVVAAAALFCAGALQMRETAEVVAALDAAYPCRSVHDRYHILVYRRDCTGTRDLGEGPVDLHFGGHGFRGDPPGPKQGRRLALLGGSTSVGPGLSDEERPAAQLQEFFGDDLEVIDLSVEGYTTVHHLIRLPEYRQRFQPDILVFDTLSRQKLFRDRVLMEYLVADDDGRPLRLKSPRESWGPLDALLGDDLRPLARTTLESLRHQRVSRAHSSDPEQVVHDVAALLEQVRGWAGGDRVFFVWDKTDLSNDRMVGVHERDAPAGALARLSPRLVVPADEAHAVLKAYDIPMVGLTEPDAALRFEGTPYYRPEGARKRMFSLGKNLEKKLAP